MAPRSSAARRTAVADALHSAAIHLLRRVRQEDDEAGVGPARLSALSVLVFGGPQRLTDLARAEQVRPPTMTKVVGALESAGFVRRVADPADARVSRVEATARGRKLLLDGAAAGWRGWRAGCDIWLPATWTSWPRPPRSWSGLRAACKFPNIFLDRPNWS